MTPTLLLLEESPGLKGCVTGEKTHTKRKTSKVGIDIAGRSGQFVKDGAANPLTNTVAT